MIYAGDFVGLLLRQKGDAYVFGHEASPRDPDPDIFDCSELVEWGCARLGVVPRMPDGSWLQVRHCGEHHTLTTVARAEQTQGALLFKFHGDPFHGPRPATAHVAVSLGNGSTIEAKNHQAGVGRFPVAGRGWTHAALVPGMTYGPPPHDPADVHPAWPGRYLTQPPVMAGDDVRIWQGRMRERGWRIAVDGKYGEASEQVCRQFQAQKGLQADGVVGPVTWRAAWTAPVTH